MLYAVGAQIPEYRVRAFNNASDSTNLIHADEHARRYGYRGGLVPGVSIFAYMSRSLVQHYCALENEGTIETRGRVIDRFERKGHHFIVLDVALFGDAGCLATVRHTAIFSIAPRAA